MISIVATTNSCCVFDSYLPPSSKIADKHPFAVWYVNGIRIRHSDRFFHVYEGYHEYFLHIPMVRPFMSGVVRCEFHTIVHRTRKRSELIRYNRATLTVVEMDFFDQALSSEIMYQHHGAAIVANFPFVRNKISDVFCGRNLMLHMYPERHPDRHPDTLFLCYFFRFANKSYYCKVIYDPAKIRPERIFVNYERGVNLLVYKRPATLIVEWDIFLNMRFTTEISNEHLSFSEEEPEITTKKSFVIKNLNEGMMKIARVRMMKPQTSSPAKDSRSSPAARSRRSFSR